MSRITFKCCRGELTCGMFIPRECRRGFFFFLLTRCSHMHIIGSFNSGDIMREYFFNKKVLDNFHLLGKCMILYKILPMKCLVLLLKCLISFFSFFFCIFSRIFLP